MLLNVRTMVNLVISLLIMMMMITMNLSIKRKAKETSLYGKLVRIMSHHGIALGEKGGLVGILSAQRLLIHILDLIWIFIVAVLIFGSLIILMR